MRVIHKLTKTIQKRVYDFLLTKYGLFILCVGSFLIVLCLIQLSDRIIEYRLVQLQRFTDVLKLGKNARFAESKTNSSGDLNDEASLDYLDERSNFKSDIDVVYTWVNGSDPAHLKQIKKYKTSNSKRKQPNSVELDEFYAKMNNFTSTNQNDRLVTYFWPCYHKFCLQTNNILIIQPELSLTHKQNLYQRSKNFFNSTDLASKLNIENYKSLNNSNVSLVHFNDLSFYENKNALDQFYALFKNFLVGSKFRIYLGFYTVDCGLNLNCISNMRQTFIAKQLKPNKFKPIIDEKKTEFSLKLPRNLSENLLFKIDYVHVPVSVFDGTQHEAKSSQKSKKPASTRRDLINSPTSTYFTIFKVRSRHLDNSLYETYLKNETILSFSDENEGKVTLNYELYRANVVWDLGDELDENFAENRFYDNDELKYSLRSLEKYAPWVRSVYLVTNGQTPSWLNLSNPRVKLIRHAEIFKNKSHLPTFSSPAIETHLHRVHNLSKKFLYFNDDVLLGKETFPDDFFTKSSGFKVRLAWSLPGCNQNCPNAWIRDGYCDKSCNTSECDFDGGDCNKTLSDSNRSPIDLMRLQLMNETESVYADLYCAPGCSTSWLADKYCDNACNVNTCGFDMGDCGVVDFPQSFYHLDLFGHINPANFTPESIFPFYKIIPTPAESNAFYVNFTLPVPFSQLKITKATYEESKQVRSVSVVNKFKLITVLLMSSKFNQTNTFHIYLIAKLNNSNQEFNLTLKIELNAFKQVTTTTTKNLSIDQTSTKLLRKISLGDKIEPDLINKFNIQQMPTNLTHLKPDNLNLTNKFLNEIYRNYYEYLEWSVRNEFLTELGFWYKLNRLYLKLNNEINSTMLKLSEMRDELKDDELIEEILFSSRNESSLMSSLEMDVFVKKFLNETNFSKDGKFLSRKLLDTFADSLKYVNRLFNQIYGFMPRKVPAHSPHLIDRQIMKRLQNKFELEFERTSSNRFRSSNDMQYSFAYYYFIMSELEEFNASKLFDEFDLNGSGMLEDSEVFVLNLRMNPKQFSSGVLSPHYAPPNEMFTLNKEFEALFNECKSNRTSLSKIRFLTCHGLVAFLKEKFWHSHFLYRHEVLSEEDAKFIMIGGEPNDIEEIIEFPVLKIDSKNFSIKSTFHQYVQPDVHKSLSQFCTELTGITQNMIDGKPNLEATLKLFDEWIRNDKDLKLDNNSSSLNFIFITCGDWDLKSMLPKQSNYFNLSYPNYFKKWINIKKSYCDVTCQFPKGMMAMLTGLSLIHEGRHHSGIDDCTNIVKIVKELGRRGHVFKQTGQIV